MSSLSGFKGLEQKLKKIDGAVAEKSLRSAAVYATTPALKAIKAAAPVGKRAHRTYKGRLVAPGFLRRSIVRRSRISRGRFKSWTQVTIGVKAEAFYGVLFVEQGTKAHKIKPRRRGGKKFLKIGNRFVRKVNHPGATAQPWFVHNFERNAPVMFGRFGQKLKQRILQASR